MARLFRTFVRNTVGRILFNTPLRDESWRNAIYARYSRGESPGTVSLDVGSGPSPRNPFRCAIVTGVDIRPGENVIVADITAGPLPVATESVDVATAYDLLEHVPRVLPSGSPGQGVRFPFVEFMNDLHRCLRPGGVFFSSTPCFPWPMAFQDPTHVNIMTEDTLRLYFCGKKPWAFMYGFSHRFTLVEAAWVGGHYNALLRKEG